jgi:hypothetical protein
MNKEEARALTILYKGQFIRQFHRFLSLPNTLELNMLNDLANKYRKAFSEYSDEDPEAEFYLG